MNVGAVGSMKRIKNAIAVARHVLENTEHTMLVGDQATEFAVMMGFKEESLSTPDSDNMWKTWKDNRCQPNFWTVRIVRNSINSKFIQIFSPVSRMSFPIPPDFVGLMNQSMQMTYIASFIGMNSVAVIMIPLE